MSYNANAELARGVNIAQQYYSGNILGWDRNLAKEAFKIVGSVDGIYETLPDNLIKAAAGRKAFLYRVVRSLLGKDTRNYPQEIGDCVSFGAKNAIEYLICCEKLMAGDRELFRSIFPPYLYGTGRVQIGGGRLGNSDGSLGSWMAEAVIKYGAIASDEEGVPNYAGSVAKTWGRNPGPPKKFLDIGVKHPVKSAAKINSWEELVAAIVNGYPCTVASNQGFRMEPNSQGYHDASGSWAHQMCIMGVDDEHSDPYALIVNSWGDVHGHLTDFTDTNEKLPVGVIRAKKRTIENMIRSGGETFAFSNFDGFPEQDLDEALFKIVGN